MPEMGGDPLEHLAADFRPEAIIEAFNDHGVQYVIVGGLAAVLHGAEVSTVDLDLVIEQSRANRDRVIDALGSLDAERITYMRDVPGPGETIPVNGDGLIEPVESFRTREGDVDLLREALVIGGFNDLSDTAQVFFVEDQELLVVDLDSLILAKEAGTERKDELQLRALYDLRDALEQEDAAELQAYEREQAGNRLGQSPESDGGRDVARAAANRANQVLEAIKRDRQAPESSPGGPAIDRTHEIERER